MDSKRAEECYKEIQEVLKKHGCMLQNAWIPVPLPQMPVQEEPQKEDDKS